jgi:putative NADH-flavin reductase
MQVTVFGASGRVGRQVVLLALEQEHTVRAFVHSHDPFKSQPGLTVIKGNVRDEKAVVAAINGSQAVIVALGSWGTKSKNVVSSGTRLIIPAMRSQGLKRIVTLTGSGARWSGDKPGFWGSIGRLFLKILAPKILRDGEEHLRLLEASNLVWTSVRSPAMSNGKFTGYKLSLQSPPLWARISRQAVAHSLIDLADNGEYPRQAPFLR